jgi:hypothetical protein
MTKRNSTGNIKSKKQSEQKRFFTIVGVTTLVVLILLYLIYRNTL